MLNRQLLHPESIAVIGASNDIGKPGGKILKNIIDGGYKGRLRAVNNEETKVQGVDTFSRADDMPFTDLAVIALPAKFCRDAVKVLAEEKNTRAFIIISAGFSELGADGKNLEDEIVSIINNSGGVLIGPNCIGVLTSSYRGVFTNPVPEYDPDGAVLISASGATAVFLLETGISRGLTFSEVYSVGNSAQTGVEDVLQHIDENYKPQNSPKVIILYLEKIDSPALLLKHASSLVSKGCRITAVKSGSSDAGSRAAMSHTGALASSDEAAGALFRKAGIIRCHGRDELVTVASVLKNTALPGKNFAVITHAGGPGVMLTDVLTKNGLSVPQITGKDSELLLKRLNPGSSISNPIDFLATGSAAQLGDIIDFAENRCGEVDSIAVIFGTPGLTPIFDVYETLSDRIKNCRKPLYPVCPSPVTAAEEVKSFINNGNLYFPDEVQLGEALAKVYNMPPLFTPASGCRIQNLSVIRDIIDSSPEGFLSPDAVHKLLAAASIPAAAEFYVSNQKDLLIAASELQYPVVMKVIGPVHKSDVGGISLNIADNSFLSVEFERMMKIPGVEGVILQQMVSGTELFAGAKYEKPFGHLILCGAGGIFVELLNDISPGLVPLSEDEALYMIRSLKSYKIFKGIRGGDYIDENIFADIILKVSDLLATAPEIAELDLNPLIAEKERITAVDARIRIEKK